MRLGPKLALTVALISALVSPLLKSACWAADTAAQPAPDNPILVPALPGLHPKASDKEALQLENKLDVRIGRLLHQVALEKFAGRLTNEQAENFLSAVNQVAEREAEVLALAGKVPPNTELRLQMELDRLQQIIISSLHDRQVATLDLSGRENALKRLVEAAVDQRRLSRQDADNLLAELKALAAQQQAVGSASGKFHYGQALVYSLKLDKLTDQFAHELRARPFTLPDISALADAVEQLQTKESKSGLENIGFTSQALNHRLPTLLSAARVAGLTPDSALLYASDLEWLKALLEQDLAGAGVAFDPDKQEKTLDLAIGGALDDGLLNPSQAQQLRLDLENIINQHHTLTQGGIALGPSDKAQLALSLSRLTGRIERTEHAPTIFWAGIDAVQAFLDERIAEGLKAGRLNADDAKALSATADDIAKTEDGLRKGGQGLAGKPALDIALQLEQLNVKLHQELKDRAVKAPDLDQLKANLAKTISDGVEVGRLDYRNPLTDKLNHIADLERAYGAAPGGLDDRAKLAVGDVIEHEIGEVKAAVDHDQTRQPQSLNMRLTQLTQDIDEAASTGVLSGQRSTQYHAAVDTVYGDLLDARKTLMTPTKGLAIANDIESLRDQFDDEVRDAATLPVQLAPRIRDLAGRVGRALAEGRLPLSEASELIAHLDRTAERLAAAASTQGGLSHGEGLHLEYEIDALADRLESSMQDNPVVLAQPQNLSIQVDTKLANGLSSGKVSIDQAHKLHAVYNDIVEDNAAFEKSDSNLSYPETLALTLEWDQLGKMIDKTAAAGPKLQDLGARREELGKLVKEALAAGKLSRKDAQALSAELDRIAQNEVNFRVTDEKLDFNEAMSLSLQLEQVRSKVNGLVRGQLSLQPKH